MAKQTINIGTTANDGTGDPIRAAFGKVNDNFTEIYTANTGVNTGDQNLSAYATTAAVAAGYQPLDSDLTAISALTTTAYGRALLSTADAATLRSAIGVGTTDAPTFLAQTLTGQSLTGTQATSLVDLSATWNTTGTPSAIKLNVTDTASNTASNLMDLQVGGASRLNVRKDGMLFFGAFAAISGDPTGKIMIRPGSGSGAAFCGALGFHASGSGTIGFAPTSPDGSPDTILARDGAAGILAQRNGLTPQAFRVYNSTDATPATNYDRGVFDFKTTTNTLRIGTENGGTYTTARPIDFVTGGVVRMSISASVPAITIGGLNVISTGGMVSNNWAGQIGWGSGSRMNHDSNGRLWITTISGTPLGFEGVTSAFPAIKRNGAGIDIRLADDSLYAALTAANLDLPSSAAASAVQQLSVGRIVYAGEGYRVGNAFQVVFSNGSDYARGIGVSASGGLAITNGTTGGQSLQFVEMTAPAAPATNGVRIYAEDNGAGKTRIMALFATGVAQQIAIEP